MAEIADLKPCPFCGGTDSTDNACQEAAVHPLEFKAPTGQRAYRVICACGAQSGADTNYFKATAAWNTRTLDAAHKRIAELEAALIMSPMAERVADLPDFMVALSEWGCEEPSEQASAITAFLNSSVGLREYLEDQSKAGGRDGN